MVCVCVCMFSAVPNFHGHVWSLVSPLVQKTYRDIFSQKSWHDWYLRILNNSKNHDEIDTYYAYLALTQSIEYLGLAVSPSSKSIGSISNSSSSSDWYCPLELEHASISQRQKNGRYPAVTQLPFHFQEWSISNFSCSLTRNVTSQSVKNLAFHSSVRWKMIILLTNSHYHLYNYLEKVGRMYQPIC